jgi:[glutamine synthetase] adenylyltransferase / [glutamine synthetase]-adenylyl-L-tyrosine phosphorylase
MRMESELAQESGEELNAKTGQGGLVDVEFTVQYLQLLHGGQLPAVRTTHTLEAIAALAAAGCVTAQSAETLRQGYLFLRGVENRLRLLHGYAMSRLPTAGKPLERLARRLGYRSRQAGDDFLRAYRACTAQVREAYAQALRGE